MPVEIKELVIRTVVNDAEAGAHDKKPAMSTGSAGSADTQAIIQECVHQVLTILDRKRER